MIADTQKPYVLLKCAMSLDGYIDDSSPERLVLSGNKDFDRVDHERSLCDAILVGAQTLRNDNPKLLIKSDKRIQERLQNGLLPNITKVTITSSGNISKDLNFFTNGDFKKIVYCSANSHSKLISSLQDIADIVPSLKTTVSPEFVLADLKNRGINRLMVEGGSKILTMFLSKGLFDELQISIAPFFIGNSRSARFVDNANFINDKNHRLKLMSVECLDDCALLTYRP